MAGGAAMTKAEIDAYVAELRSSPTRPTDWDEKTERIIRRACTQGRTREDHPRKARMQERQTWQGTSRTTRPGI
jgi:hypothetical protein